MVAYTIPTLVKSIHQSKTLEAVNKMDMFKVVDRVCKILATGTDKMLALHNQSKVETTHYQECFIFIEIEGTSIQE